MSARYVIGIDPDTDKNGYALLNNETGELRVGTAPLPALLEWVAIIQATATAAGEKLEVYLEAGWLASHNWHLDRCDNKERAAAKGKSQGRNEQRGRDIGELLEAAGVTVIPVPPLKKVWRGYNRKITHDELCRVVGQQVRHTNQEGRDAALIAWVNGQS